MLKQQFPTHFFHAYGYGLGATLTKPFPAVVESQAATTIASVGGHAFNAAGPFNLKEIIRFDRASTQIAAVDDGGSYDTVITTCIEGVNIFNQFTADRIVAHLAIKNTKPVNGQKAPDSYRTVGSSFVNLRVGGVPVNPVLVQDQDADYSSGKAAKPVFDQFDGKPIKQDYKDPHGYLTTLVSDLKVDSTHVKVMGNAIHVPDFGVVYLAEYLVTPYARHLTMFRIELGCSGSGCASGGGTGGNGSTVPPQG